MAVTGITPQRSDWILCQICGRSALPGSKHWLNQPHREIFAFSVQRCPQHWTDWALRNTVEGRTDRNRAMMHDAREQKAPTIHPYLEPWSPTPLPDDDAILVENDAPLTGRIFGRVNARAQALRLLKSRHKK